jgi:hypothetical protein
MVVKEYSLKVDTATAQKNVEELNSSFEAQTELIDELENDLFDYEKALRNTSKTNLAARESLNKKIQKTKDALKDEKKGLKDVTKERKKANESLKEAEENAADYSGVLGVIDSKTGGLISGFSGMTKSIGGATKGFNLMKVAIIGTGIGALIIALTSLQAAFTSSEEGQNKWNKIMGILGATVSVFTDRLASLGEGLINLFTSPVETLKNFGKSVKEFVMDKIDAAVESLGFMGSAISKLFSGDFSGALEDAGKGIVGLNKALNPAVIITNALIDSTKELTKEILEEGKAASKIADQRAAADKLDRQLIVDRAIANKERADLLNKAVDKEKFSLQERINFLTLAGQKEDEITAKEIAAAKLRLDAKISENALGKSTKEDLQEEASLRANLMNLETAKLSKAKEVTSQIIGLKAEEKAAEQALADFKKSLRDAEAVTEEEKRALELLKIQEHYDALILQAEENNINTDALKEARDVMLKEKQDAFDLTDQERKDGLAQKEKDRKDKQLKEDEDRVKEEIRLEQEKTAAKEKAFADAVTIAGADSKLGKAILIAKQLLQAKEMIMELKGTLFTAKQSATKSVVKASEAGVDVSTGAAKAASAAPFPLNVPLILGYAAQAIGIVSAIRGAMKTSKQATSKIGVSAPSPSIDAPPTVSASAPPSAPEVQSIPPEFNTVGASSTNQLADAIGGQSQQPVQAYVVSNDISTAQELDRNIVQGATIG